MCACACACACLCACVCYSVCASACACVCVHVCMERKRDSEGGYRGRDRRGRGMEGISLTMIEIMVWFCLGNSGSVEGVKTTCIGFPFRWTLCGCFVCVCVCVCVGLQVSFLKLTEQMDDL